MSEFLLDLAADARHREGVWTECSEPLLELDGIKFLVKPLTTSVGKLLDARIRGTKDALKVARLTLEILLLGAQGIGIEGREATTEEVVAHFVETPEFIKWLVERAAALATCAREAAAADLEN